MSKDLPPILFPRILYGDAPTTRAAWRRLLAMAWKCGAFTPFFKELEMVPVESLPGDVITGMVRRDNPKKHETHWWPLWVTKDRPRQLKGLQSQGPVDPKYAALLAREQSLILDGMKHPWFVVGLIDEPIGNDRAFDYSQWQSRDEKCERLLLPMLRQFIDWLPELSRLQKRYACVAIQFWRHPVFRHNWLVGIMGCALQCGYYFDTVDWTRTINVHFGGDGVRALLETGIIARVGDRFRLREDTRHPE